MSAAIEPQPTAGSPVLEAAGAKAGAPAPSAPPPQLDGAEQGLTPAPIGWTPEQAALATTGLHNAVGVPLFARKPPLLQAWTADPRELNGAEAALARVYDRFLPWMQPGAGAMGILGDLLIGGQAVLMMEIRHIDEVRKANDRVERELARQAAQRPTPAAGPPRAAPSRPSVVPDAAGDDEYSGDRFRFDPALNDVLRSQPERGAQMLNHEEATP